MTSVYSDQIRAVETLRDEIETAYKSGDISRALSIDAEFTRHICGLEVNARTYWREQRKQSAKCLFLCI